MKASLLLYCLFQEGDGKSRVPNGSYEICFEMTATVQMITLLGVAFDSAELGGCSECSKDFDTSW